MRKRPRLELVTMSKKAVQINVQLKRNQLSSTNYLLKNLPLLLGRIHLNKDHPEKSIKTAVGPGIIITEIRPVLTSSITLVSDQGETITDTIRAGPILLKTETDILTDHLSISTTAVEDLHNRVDHLIVISRSTGLKEEAGHLILPDTTTVVVTKEVITIEVAIIIIATVAVVEEKGIAEVKINKIEVGVGSECFN